MGRGEVYALLTGVVWALAVVLFRRSGERLSPLGLNLFKNLAVLPLLIPTAWVLGNGSLEVEARDARILFLSGMLGIGLGDSLFFASLNRIGASRAALVDCLYSPFVVLFAFFLLGERLGPWSAAGGVLIVSSIGLAATESDKKEVGRLQLLTGLGLGSLAMICMAWGITMAKPVLERYPVPLATLVRLAGGIAILLVVILLTPGRRRELATLRPQRAWIFALPAAFLSTYVAMLLWIAGFKYTQATTASLLNQLSAAFMVIFAAIFLKERLTAVRVVAVLLALSGSLLILR